MIHPFSRSGKLAIALFLLVSAQASMPSALALGPFTRAWSRTITVVAGEEGSVTGGIDFATNIHVTGTLKVSSCCGFSTDDIGFHITGVDAGGVDFGIVVGARAFEWVSQENDRYDFILDNRWIVCGGTPLACARNQSSPSYHDKIVELNVTEVAPWTPYVFTVLRLWFPFMVVLGVAAGVLVIMLLRKRSGRAKP